MPQLRQNIITGHWVVIAPERSKRPNDFIQKTEIRPHDDENCVFCTDGPAYQTQLPDYETNNIYTIPNKYPVFVEDVSMCSPRKYKTEDDFYVAKPALGGHDVIVVKEHHVDIFSFSHSTWNKLFESIKKRYNYWRKSCNTEYTMAIYNQGTRAAASITHPHAQLIASDIVPNQVHRELVGSLNYYNKNNQCVFCDMVKHEQKEKVRIIAENDLFIAFTFYAARFPYEVWLLPKHHKAYFESETENSINELSKIIKTVFHKMDKTLVRPPLNFYIHDAPASLEETDHYHWHIEITPRLTNYGGYELGSGVIVDVQSPEEAAYYLNKESQ